MTIKPYNYQLDAIYKMRHLPGFLVADEMGTGKSVVALWEIREQANPGDKVLVVCPKSVISVWTDHAEEILADTLVDLTITNWDQLRLRPEFANTKWRWVIADGSHYLKNRQAQRTKALWRIPATYRRALTGTPIINRPDELWSILKWMYPDQFRSYWKFFEQYVDYETGYAYGKPTGYKVVKGPKNTDQLRQLLQPIMIRRLKKDVLHELPDKYYSRIRVELTAPQRRIYEEMRREALSWVGAHENEPVPAPVAIAKLTRLRQFTGAYANVDDAGKVKLTEPSAKLDAMMDIVTGNGPVVVFSQFAQMIELAKARLEKAGIAHVVLTGQTSDKDRKRAVSDFQAGNAKVFLGTLGAGGVGITLTAASTVVFLDRSWSPAVNQQAEDRCVLEGQPVLTADGWTPIEDVNIGDYVVGMDGLLHRVINKWSRNAKGGDVLRSKDITEICVRGWNAPICVTSDHRMLTGRGWVEARDVRPRDRLIMPAAYEKPHTSSIPVLDEVRGVPVFHAGGHQVFGDFYAQPRTKPVSVQRNARLVTLPDKMQLTTEALFVLGYYIGDGFASVGDEKGRFVSFSGHKLQKSTFIGTCRKWAASFGVNGTVYEPGGQRCELRVFSAELARWVAMHFGKTLTDKKLPEWIFELSKEQRAAFLLGWEAADGYQRVPNGGSGALRHEIVTAKKNLAAQCARLLMSLGQKPCVHYGEQARAWTVGWTENEPPSLAVSNVLHRTAKHGEKVYDLTVKDAESFVVGTAVVHNCHRIGQEQAVHVINIEADKTVDQVVESKLELKWRTIRSILGG